MNAASSEAGASHQVEQHRIICNLVVLTDLVGTNSAMAPERRTWRPASTTAPSLPSSRKQCRGRLTMSSKTSSILDKLYMKRTGDVAWVQSTAGTTSQLLASYLLDISPPLISFVNRLKQNTSGSSSLLAEIKRASPSQDPISVAMSPRSQAFTYSIGGTHTISVLEEPKLLLILLHWQDMLPSSARAGRPRARRSARCRGPARLPL
ncbi:uncharacterized protein SCHCODRAFT_02665183 [Schizophyllum commune H4-8]|nr:uncharacterized protein SCHCODRAFT_02665183 [Schizophyllum commune H4-8]KAI5894716.1 hypothetical protein SCHCODRAFT_02665183 [Schizophyllum commune H4-8]